MTKTPRLVVQKSELMDDARSISTAQAAKMVGISMSLVQKLVDQEAFKAWKTPGGHRRIDLSSVQDYQQRVQLSPALKVNNPSLPVIKIIVEDVSLSDRLLEELKNWPNYFDISCWHSIPEAFLSFTNQIPDILIVQMSAPLPQQVSTFSAVRNFLERTPKPFSVVCLSDAPELSTALDESISSTIQLLSQAMTPEWLKAFLIGVNAATMATKLQTTELQ
jgi:excisionase family DNA binding protein